MDITLETIISGKKLSNPLMNASGILGDAPDAIRLLNSMGFGCIVTKTLTLRPREGYRPPIIVPLDYGLINAVGLANPGIRIGAELVFAARNNGIPIALSIGGKTSKEFIELATIAMEYDPDFIELNLSCPHTPGYGIDAAKTVKAIKDIVCSVASIASIPIWAKLSFSRNLVSEAEAALSCGASTIVLINTIPAMVIDPYIKTPILSHGWGGLSGPAIHPIAVYSVYRVYEELNAEIIGVGGAETWRDVIEFILAGASAVQIGTGLIRKGHNIVREIIHGIKSYMREIGAKSIHELIGIAHKK